MVTSLTTNFNAGTNLLVEISDSCGTTRSVPCTVTIASIANKTVAAAPSVTLGAVAFSSTAPRPAITSYQWWFNGAPLADGTKYTGTTTGTLTILNATSADSGVYSNVVVSAWGAAAPKATLTVYDAITGVTVNPASTNALWGQPVQFTTTVAGGAVQTWRWHKDGVQINNLAGKYTGATSGTLTVLNVTTADAGTYDVGATNTANGVLSSTAALTVSVPQPLMGTVTTDGSKVSLTFTSPSNPYDTTNAYYLQYSPVVTGPYTNVTTLGADAFKYDSGTSTFTVTNAQYVDPNGFYRLLHK